MWDPHVMTELEETPASELLLAALEAVTGALRAVEAISAVPRQMSDGQRDRQQHLDKAFDHLRAAIAELRSAHEADPHPGAAGFVLAGRRRREPAGHTERPELED